jgi:hypothetical protein
MTISKQSAGGRANALKLRKNTLENYYKNPNFCKFCHDIIKVKDNQTVGDVRKKKFCDKKCYGKYVQINVNPIKFKEERDPKSRICKRCRINTVDSNRVKLCSKCSYEYSVLYKTKGELFSIRKNWQSARSNIQKIARSIYFKSDKPRECLICRYNTFIDVAHIKPVSEFLESALISEINSIDNLVALCKNHHWEYDHKIIKL